MKLHHLALVGLLGLGALNGPAWSASVGEETGVNAVLGMAPSTEDFVAQAAMSDLFELRSSELAAARGDAPAKAFAQQMLADHKRTSDELLALLKEQDVEARAPQALDAVHQEKLDALTAASGDDFSTMYREQQVEAHEYAVSLFQRYGEGGEHAALKAWAAKTAPVLEHHLQMARDLNKT